MRTDGSTQSVPRGVAKNLGEVAQDFLSLVELQFELGRSDARNAVGRLAMPIILLVVAAAIALGTIPVALLFAADVLVAAGLPRWLALLVATALGLGAVAIAGAVAWRGLRKPLRLFSRSRDELQHNIRWIKQVLTRHETQP